ncbi:MAG: hypothetical protein OK438_03370 [Thaumarchaeota archaeon]|nr:hypothetical protein [Nitrososphaerota archaeon]
MDYFEAVQEGRVRVQEAINVLQPVVGQCYPMLFLKIGVGDWTPVGTELLYSLVLGKADTAAVVLCDSEGNSKAMSSWIPRAKAEEYTGMLAGKGIPRFEGEVKLPI